jgi:hypothetical protein
MIERLKRTQTLQQKVGRCFSVLAHILSCS